MFLSDAGDYYSIAACLHRDDQKRAYDKASRLDTAARDGIPGDVWDYLLDLREQG